jgi:hypothetical protein
MNLRAGILGALLSCISLGVASAATIMGGGGNLPELVHSTGAQSSMTVTGITPTGYIVDLHSADTITVAGGGASMFNCASPGCSTITVTLPPGPPSSNLGLEGFSALEFDLPDVSGDFDVTVNFRGGGSQMFQDVIVTSNKKYEIVAGPGQTIVSITIGGADSSRGLAENITQLKLISFDAVVPEPASWLMMIVGMGAVGAGLRMSRRQASRLAA